MGKCIYCGNLSKNKNKASLHRFPRDAALREQWIKFIGRENWIPKDSSYLCSDHFHKDCFNVHHNNRKCIKPGSVPTISLHQETFKEPSNILVESNHENINEYIATSEEIPEVSMCVEYSDSPTSSREIVVEDSQPSTSKKNVTKFQPMTTYENMRHDHHYERTLTSTLKKLSNMRRKLVSTLKNNEMLKRKVKRLKVKVNSLKEVANGLKEQKLLSENAFFNLSALEDTTLEIFNRMLKNGKGKISRDRYPPKLRAFALTVHFYSPKAYSYIRKTFNLALPHPDVLKTWYTSVDEEPGFTDESFNTPKGTAESSITT